MKGYLYPVSYLPIIITDKGIEDFKNLTSKAANILFHNIMKVFTNDIETFRKFYGNAYDQLISYSNPELELKNLMLRYDLLYSDNKIKLLELNTGTNIGGWQAGLLCPLILRNLADLADITSWGLHYEDILTNMLKYLLDVAIHHKGKHVSGNIVIMLEKQNLDKEIVDEIQNEYSNLYKKIQPAQYPESRLLFCFDADKLIFNEDCSIYLDTFEVDAVAILGTGRRFPKPELIKSHLEGKIFYTDNTISLLMGDKMNFAFIHWMADNDMLQQDDASFVRSYFPWSASCADDMVQWKGKSISLHQLLVEYKHHVVIKKGRSFQGNDVFIGRFIDNKEWEDVIAKVKNENGWIVQEYCEADKLDFITNDINVAPHNSVWGVFGFRNKYAGSWVRLSEIAEGQSGVINCAQGAKEIIVLQES
ncbi:hypothetical protein JMN32_08555 [Fulvivirga sp. 29W222]|uniref:Glutathionylspermidine synthase pre-ATP-grasp-like domain-containing protein n=1 Tax=Fulvivirga marina TaxID=2494733 RepID=A0A937KB32_9BACT|nr:hypothetical protein [Fulvivirga marina]MBL6446356.1 hypothetical protein [Fulvivirga marina]